MSDLVGQLVEGGRQFAVVGGLRRLAVAARRVHTPHHVVQLGRRQQAWTNSRAGGHGKMTYLHGGSREADLLTRGVAGN